MLTFLLFVHVCAILQAEEDLYLTSSSPDGSEINANHHHHHHRHCRVTAGTSHPCLMLKTQRFRSLFRHYAKYHGLRKEDLEYYCFVNHSLETEDTPESVQLQQGGTIL